MFLIFNISKHNPILDSYFIIPRLYDPFKYDNFNIEQSLFENNAVQTKFWELIILKKSSISEIRLISDNLTGKIKESLDYIELENFSKLTLKELLKKKLKKIKEL